MRKPAQPPNQSRLIDAAWQQAAPAVADSSKTWLMAGRAPAGGDPGFEPLADGSLPGYQLVREIRRGGQGVVYEAIQQSTSRTVAIKVMRTGPFASERDKIRFDREVQILAQLRHPNIVTVHDSGSAAGAAYFVMDYIPGDQLDDYLRRVNPPLRDRLRLFAKICDAVNVAHLRGVIHRDLKPGNVRIDGEGQPHVLDFGLAKATDWAALASDDGEPMTMTGHFVGSLPWASPEQIEGRPERIDLRTDVYALGIILYQLLTDCLPHPATMNVRDALDHILHTEPTNPRLLKRELDGEISTIALKCLQKDRERRYQSAAELGRDVQRYLAGEPIEARRDSFIYVMRKQLARHRLPAFAVVAFVVLLASSSIVAWSLYAKAERAGQTADQRASDATRRLWESYVAQARAGRSGNRLGRRFDSLAALARAGAIRVDPELRDEAIACMTLTDLRLERQLEDVPGCAAFGLRRIDRFAFSPARGTVVVRALDEARDLARLEGPDAEVYGTKFSPDGRYLGIRYGLGNEGAALWAWDIERSSPVLKLKSDNLRRDGLAFGPANAPEWLAVCASTGGIELYRLPTGAPWKTIGADEAVRRLAADPEGTRIAATMREDQAIGVWDVHSGVPARIIEPADEIADVCWSWDGGSLATPSYGFRVYIWDAQTFKLQGTLEGHQGAAVSALFGAESDVVVTGSWDGTVRLWSLVTGQQVLEPLEEVILGGYGGSLLLRDLDQRSGRIWSLHSESPLRTLTTDSKFSALGFADLSVDGRLYVTAGENGVRLWDAVAGCETALLDESSARWCAFLPQGRGVLATVEDGVRYWPMHIEDNGSVGIGQPAMLWSESQTVECSLHPDGRGLVIAGPRLRIVDLDSGQERNSFAGYAGMERPSISPDGHWIFTGSWHGRSARVRNALTGEVVLEIPGRSVRGELSPDGRWLAVLTSAEHAYYRVGTWELVRSIPRRADYGLAGPVAFTPDARTVAVMHTRFSVRLVDVETGAALATLPNPELNAITALKFSATGQTLVATTSDRNVMIWDMAQIRAELRALGLDW